MRGARRSVLDSSTFEAPTAKVQRSWGCAPSTSYSTSNVDLQHTPFRLPQRTNIHSLSFSLQIDSQSALSRRHPTASAGKHKCPHQHLTSALGSISLSLPLAQPRKQKRRQAALQGVGFEVSNLRPNQSNCVALTGPSSSNALSIASTSFASSSFEFSHNSSVHTQLPLFASVSSACSSQMRKRKAPSITTDRPSGSVASGSGRSAAVRHAPVMQLAQGTAKAISRAMEEREEGHRPDLAAAGSTLRKSAMTLPRNIRRLLAGAFAGALSKTVIAPIETIRMQVMGNKVCCQFASPSLLCCLVAFVSSLHALNATFWHWTRCSLLRAMASTCLMFAIAYPMPVCIPGETRLLSPLPFPSACCTANSQATRVLVMI